MVGSDGRAALPGANSLLGGCFFVSGGTALLYQTVWMRLSLAAFGVNTPVVATVLAAFMLGLALGTFLAARAVPRLDRAPPVAALRAYGLAELAVGFGGVVVPYFLHAGRELLLALGPADGGAYTACSALLLAAILIPFCTAMGFTLPAAVAFLRRAGPGGEGARPFSALYLANVAGALTGAVATPLVLIERYGFRATSLGAVAGNLAIAAAALLAYRGGRTASAPPPSERDGAAAPGTGSLGRQTALFVTGFTTMGMEVVWTRMYPAILGTFVYSFAAILAIYLLATTAGSAVYRATRRRGVATRPGAWWPWLYVASLLPLLTAASSFPAIAGLARVAAGLAPFCALLGYLTPMLVDAEAGDDPVRVGRAYGVNLVGSLAGPIVAGFVLLPALGARGAVVLLALPIFALVAVPPFRSEGTPWLRFVALGAAALVWLRSDLFETAFPREQVRTDAVATVVAAGSGLGKKLYVNGIGMTELTTITKMMAHFPAAHLAVRPGEGFDALVICFGMGTSFRSLDAWGARVTAVELVPSVTSFFGYYFPDGPERLRAAGGRLRIVHDDGRRFLDRTGGRFDLITIDPPPPVEAAASSLLYSEEFYAAARRKMKPGAILQMWLPGGDRATVAGVAGSILASFPHVRAFASIQGFGIHFLASDRPIPRLTPDELVGRMPEAAVHDMTEWIDAPPARFFERMLAKEFDPGSLAAADGPASRPITDDRPVNEFFFMRRAFGPDGSLRRTIEFIRP